MTLLNILSAARSRQPRAKSPSARRARIGLESLEARRVLSTFTVSSVADSGAGSLRAAILAADQASDAATINFAATLANQTITPASALPVFVNSHGIQVNGPASAKVTINLQNAFKADTQDTGYVNAGGNGLNVVNGTTLTLGSGSASANIDLDNSGGRGIENHGTLNVFGGEVSNNRNGGAVNYGSMTLNGTNVHDNQAARYGGAVNNYGGSLTLTNATLRANSAPVAGGGIDSTGGSVTATGTTFQSNYGNPNTTFDEDGGAIYMDGGATVTISNSTFTGNLAAIGGAIHNNGGNLAVSGSTFSNNWSQYGGAIDDDGLAQTVLTANTMTGNHSSGPGGAIWVDGRAPKLVGNDIYNNVAASGGSNIYGKVDKASSNNVIGAGDNLSGIVDHPGAASGGVQQNFIGSNPSSQIQPVMSITNKVVQLAGSDTMTYSYTYDVRKNTGKLVLNAKNAGTSDRRIAMFADHLVLNEGPGNSGVGPFNQIRFSANNQDYDTLSISMGYDAPTKVTGNPLATPAMTVEINNGYWTDSLRPDVADTAVTVHTAADVANWTGTKKS